MTRTEEKQMLRDIHRITLALESISKSIKTSIVIPTIGETKETDEEQRLYSKPSESFNIEWSEETRE